MYLTKSIFKIISIILILIGFNKAYADGHKSKKGPQFEYFGSLSYVDITRFNDYKENFIADLPDGNLILANGDKGKIASPCADYGKLQKERTIDLDVRCSITMEDGSELYIFYGGKMIFDEKSDKLNEEGKTLTPKNGLAYWVSAPLIRTSSEKYDYMNDIQLIGIGRNAKMAPPINATYDLYKIVYSK